MKTTLLRPAILAAALGVVAAPLSMSWIRPLDASPEAMFTGGGLLVIASLLRYTRTLSRQ